MEPDKLEGGQAGDNQVNSGQEDNQDSSSSSSDTSHNRLQSAIGRIGKQKKAGSIQSAFSSSSASCSHCTSEPSNQRQTSSNTQNQNKKTLGAFSSSDSSQSSPLRGDEVQEHGEQKTAGVEEEAAPPAELLLPLPRQLELELGDTGDSTDHHHSHHDHSSFGEDGGQPPDQQMVGLLVEEDPPAAAAAVEEAEEEDQGTNPLSKLNRKTMVKNRFTDDAFLIEAMAFLFLKSKSNCVLRTTGKSQAKATSKCKCLEPLGGETNQQVTKRRMVAQFMLDYGKKTPKDRLIYKISYISLQQDCVPATVPKSAGSHQKYRLPYCATASTGYDPALGLHDHFICASAWLTIIDKHNTRWRKIQKCISLGITHPEHGNTGNTNACLSNHVVGKLESFFADLSALSAPRSTLVVRLSLIHI